MHALPSRRAALASKLHLLAAALGILAQLVLVFAPVAEGRAGVGMRAHVESHGNPAHHVHEEATCVACQVRTLYGVARTRPVAPAVSRTPSTVPLLREQLAASAELVADALPRAPPA